MKHFSQTTYRLLIATQIDGKKSVELADYLSSLPFPSISVGDTLSTRKVPNDAEFEEWKVKSIDHDFEDTDSGTLNCYTCIWVGPLNNLKD